ncbi:MAG: hypothetical protein ACKVOO_08240 [Burkholderiaceae bacterium]
MTISAAARAFFVELGVRVATLRKARNIAQVQFASLPRAKQQVVMQMLDGLLAGAAR